MPSIFLAILGAIYPARWAAAQVIRTRLSDCRMNPALFPIGALASDAVSYAKMRAQVSRQWYRIYLQESAETSAMTAVLIATGEGGCTAAEIRAEVQRGISNPTWEILAKHDPKRFGLDELEMTQHANRLLLKDRS